MSEKIDVFAHVLPTRMFAQIKRDVPDIMTKYSFLQIPALTDLTIRQQGFSQDVKQVISNVNLNPEDFYDVKKAAVLCNEGNQELSELVKQHPDLFVGAVAMVPMNNLEQAVEIINNLPSQKFTGIQLFTRALGKSIADPSFEAIFAAMEKVNLPIFLHPVFDERKPDNNITFSWEYELTQAMYQIVQAGYFEKYPNLKIIVHHAGAMVPFFAGRIKYTMSAQEYADFQKFYVDTAILGNTKALELAVDFFDEGHVLFGTDAPFAVMPNGATTEILTAISEMDVSKEIKQGIYRENFLKLLRR